MTGRKTLREIREQLAAARANATAPITDPAGVLESLDRLADELGRTAKDGNDIQLPAKVKEAAPGTSSAASPLE